MAAQIGVRAVGTETESHGGPCGLKRGDLLEALRLADRGVAVVGRREEQVTAIGRDPHAAQLIDRARRAFDRHRGAQAMAARIDDVEVGLLMRHHIERLAVRREREAFGPMRDMDPVEGFASIAIDDGDGIGAFSDAKIFPVAWLTASQCGLPPRSMRSTSSESGSMASSALPSSPVVHSVPRSSIITPCGATLAPTSIRRSSDFDARSMTAMRRSGSVFLPKMPPP